MPDEAKHALSRDDAMRIANDFMLANQQMGRDLIEAGKARNKHRVLGVIIEYAVSQIQYTNNLIYIPRALDFMDERSADEYKKTLHDILD